MLDIKRIINNKEEVREALLKRLPKNDVDLDVIIFLEEKRKNITTELEVLQAKKNQYSKTKPDKKIIAEIKGLSKEIKKQEDDLKKTKADLKEKLSALPNTVSEDVKAGDKENNEVIFTHLEKPNYDFKNLDHVTLAENLDVIDYKRASKMSGNGFWIYKDKGAWLEWALYNYFLDFHRENKYQFMIMPELLNRESAYASGHLPKFEEDLFWTENSKLCLNATAEMMLTNYHREEILDEKDLPLKYFSLATSFRREAGSYRKNERGMIRGHQFNKVEMFQFTKAEDSWQAFEQMTQEVIELMKGLDLHFQVSKLAAKDCSAAMAKTCDIEVWIPSMEVYKEVSSISNATDYQARRANIRYKDAKTKKNLFAHTLNASGLATSRVIPAILEQNQNADASVKVPKILHKYLPKEYHILK
jgi:seryl-tRNA synthetase